MKKYLALFLALALMISGLSVASVEVKAANATEYNTNLLEEPNFLQLGRYDSIDAVKSSGQYSVYYVSEDSAWKPMAKNDWMVKLDYGIMPFDVNVATNNHFINQTVSFFGIDNGNTEVRASVDYKKNTHKDDVILAVTYQDKYGNVLDGGRAETSNLEEGTLSIVDSVPEGAAKIFYQFGQIWSTEGWTMSAPVNFSNPDLRFKKKAILGNPVQSVDVIFDYNNGEGYSYTETITKGNTVDELDSPYTSGYVFLGWTLNGEMYDFNTPVNESITLKAKWEAVEEGETVKVTFDPDNGEAAWTEEQIKGDTLSFTRGRPEKEGYSFKWWELVGEEGREYDDSRVLTRDIRLKAIWTEREEGAKFWVRFLADGGDYTPAEQIVEDGGYATNPLPAYPKKAGYEFIGWYNNNGKFDFEHDKITGNTYLKAKYRAADSHLIYFDLRGGKTARGQYMAPKSVIHGKLLDEINIPINRGSQETMGFYTPKGEFNFGTPITKDMVLYARFENPQGYTYDKQKRMDIVVPDFYYDRAIIKYDGAIFTGYPDNTFRPDESMTRAQAATVLAKILGIDEDVKTENIFSDIDGHWAKKYILNVADYGILNGYPDGTFRPDAKIKRSEIASIVDQYWKAKVFTPDGYYADIKDIENHWSRKAVSHLYNHGFVDVYDDRLYKPDDYLSRKDAALLFNRLTDRMIGHEDYQMFTDVPKEDMFFEEINAAASDR